MSYYLNFTFLSFSISIFLILFVFKLLTFAFVPLLSCMCPFGMPFLLISRLVGLDFSLLSPVSLIIVQRVLVRHTLIAYLGSLDLVAIKLY